MNQIRTLLEIELTFRVRLDLITINIIVKDDNWGVFRLLKQQLLLLVKVDQLIALIGCISLLLDVSLAKINFFGLDRAIDMGEEGCVHLRIRLISWLEE